MLTKSLNYLALSLAEISLNGEYERDITDVAQH